MITPLEEKLFSKYPKLFGQKDLPLTHSLMGFGIECGDGWYWLLDQVCHCIQNHIKCNSKTCGQVEFTQVKEKYGRLTIYTNTGDDYIFGILHFAEELSWAICEECGSTEGIQHTSGWIKTYCRKCMQKHGKTEDYQK